MKKHYSTGTWATYNQWHELGAQVRKDEKSTHIAFWKPLSKTDDKGEESSFWMAKAYYVFNADQVEGYEIPGNTLPVIASPAETLEHVEAFVAGLGAYIRHGLPRAYYNTALDYVNMPQRDVFTGSPTSTPTEAYYSTLFHELTHWTGHKSRLDRMEKSGQHEYAFEELVAELGAAFMCADLNVSNSPRPDHAAYIASWLKALKNDSKFIFTAASKAQKAADYLQSVKAQPVAVAA
jgi:antirestriction protein ArdC